MKHYTKTAVLLLLLLFSASCNKEQDNIPFSTETLESGISEEKPEIGITSENESFEQINESFSIPREEIVIENITLADEPEEIALSDEEMRSYRQQEAAAFKEKLLSEMNGESGVKFAVVSCVGTGMPELIVAKPLNPYGMYSMEIYQLDGEFTSCGTIEGNNIQYILGGNGISITSYTDIGSADGSLTSVSLNCYQYDNNRISLAETYNYTLQYTYDLGSMAVTGTNKNYTVTASDSGGTETLTKDEFYRRIDNIAVEYQVMLYDLTKENISAVLNDENSYPHSMTVENRTFFELYD